MNTPLSENKELLHQTKQAMTDEPAQYAEQVAALQAKVKEIDEAIAAGRKVLVGLEEVIEALDSARKWGIWDMLGGRLFSTLAKHSRIDRAREGIDNVRRMMHQFKRELTDVQNQVELRIDISDFESFADVFLDGFVFDWIVQNKINDALSQAHQAKAAVFQVVSNLEGLKRAAQRKQSELQKRRVQS